LLIARKLRHHDITVVVSSVYALNALIESPNIELITLGGSLYQPGMSFVGPLAEEFLDRIHVDKLFLGVNGVSPEGVSVNNVQEAGVKRKMIAAADQVIALADASKVGMNSFVFLAPLKQVHTLVTNSGISSESLEPFYESGLEVLIV